MKKLLLTGATGFIGRHCFPYLHEKDFEIHAVSSKKSRDDRANWHVCDLLKKDEVDALLAKVQPEYLLHLAWYVTPGKFWSAPENLLGTQASLHLLSTFKKYGGRRHVMAGTCAEYDWKFPILSEVNTPLLPRTLYGTCKHSLQQIVSAYSKESNLSSAWGRIFHLYGPHEDPNRLISSVILSLLKGKEARCTEGTQIRDFTHVSDVASAFVSLLDSDVTGPVNIASGHRISIQQIVSLIAEMMNRKELLRFGAIPTPIGDPIKLVADTSRLTQEVQWAPHFDLTEGVSQTIRWWECQ